MGEGLGGDDEETAAEAKADRACARYERIATCWLPKCSPRMPNSATWSIFAASTHQKVLSSAENPSL